MPVCSLGRIGDWRVAATALAIALGVECHSQTLNLGAPEPPTLDSFNFANDLVGTLQSEIAARLAGEDSLPDVMRDMSRAGTNLRVLAADLLSIGNAAGHEGSAAILAGFTLASNRTLVDEALARLAAAADGVVSISGGGAETNPPAAGSMAAIERAVESIRYFNSEMAGMKDRQGTASPESIDAHLRTILSPLAEAVTLFENVAPSDHWIVLDRPGETTGVVDPPPLEATSAIADLRVRLETSTLAETTGANLVRILDFLEQGQEFAEFRARIEPYRALVAGAVVMGETLARSTWMEEADKAAWLDRVDRAVTLFTDRATREEGASALSRLEPLRRALDRITALAEAKRDRINVQPLQVALLAIDGSQDDPAMAQAGEERLRRFINVLDRMNQYRQITRRELRRELRLAAAKLDRSYQDAEASLIDQLGMLAADPGAMSDPAFLSLLDNQSQYVEDIIRVEKMPAWIDTIKSIEAKAAERFELQTRRMAGGLVDPSSRQDAIMAMDQFEQQLALFVPLPFESHLKAGDADAAAVTGGQQAALALEITAQRVKWAEAWAAGDAGSAAANRMLLLHRLTRIMADSVEVTKLGGDATLLNAWAAWEHAPQSVAAAVSEVPNRLRLATRAAIDGNDDELRNQLTRMDEDAARAKLVGRLAELIAPALTSLPQGAAGALNQCIRPPGEEAFLRSQRMALAHLCRYALEESYARAGGRDTIAADCAEYVSSLAEELLDHLGDRRAPIPALIGFDGGAG